MREKIILIFLILSVFSTCHASPLTDQEVEAVKYLQIVNDEMNQMRNLESKGEWAFLTNMTDENEERQNEIYAKVAKFFKEKAKEMRKFDYENFNNEDLKRQFRLLSNLGYAVLPESDYKDITDAKMQGNYGRVTICDYKDRTKCNLALTPEIEHVFAKSMDHDELKYYWKEWYDKAGTPVRKHFEKYVEMNTKAAQLNNFPSGAESWLSKYEDSTFEQQLENIMNEIRPLYEQIHAFVRWKLRNFYGDSVVSRTGPIPMHLLGNVWAQSWKEISDIVQPYPGKVEIDVTNEMIRQGYTPLKMFQMADEFFQSLNIEKLPKKFWEKSIIEKPKDGRDFMCHATSFDFYSKDDARIKMCTSVNMADFFTIHHEMGHIEYFLLYGHLPHAYRDGANPGFHEGVGDVLSLSVSTPKHLEKIGLLNNYILDKETTINVLFLRAIDKFVQIPFAYTMDKYRWGVFRDQIPKNKYNCAFWELRNLYSGVEPPVRRTEQDFDPPAEYHISADFDYTRYFVATILQFQIYKAACLKAGQYQPRNPNLPLHNCDIYGSTEAGNAFKSMLALGSSRPWPDILEMFTGEQKMSGSAILEYFEPFREWLKKENLKNNAYVGWSDTKMCIKVMVAAAGNYWIMCKCIFQVFFRSHKTYRSAILK